MSFDGADKDPQIAIWFSEAVVRYVSGRRHGVAWQGRAFFFWSDETQHNLKCNGKDRLTVAVWRAEQCKFTPI